MSVGKTLRRLLGSVELTILDVGAGGPSLRVSLADALSPEGIDDRIARLDAIQRDLAAAVTAVGELKIQALERKDELKALQDRVKQLQEDRCGPDDVVHAIRSANSRMATCAQAWRTSAGCTVAGHRP